MRPYVIWTKATSNLSSVSDVIVLDQQAVLGQALIDAVILGVRENTRSKTVLSKGLIESQLVSVQKPSAWRARLATPAD